MTGQHPPQPRAGESDRAAPQYVMDRSAAPLRICCVGFDGDRADVPERLARVAASSGSIRSVATSDDALAALEDVDCIVSAHDLPETTGLELLRSVRDVDAKFPFVLAPAAGVGGEGLASRAISAGVTEYIPGGEWRATDAGTETKAAADADAAFAADLIERLEDAVDRYRAERDARRTHLALETAQEGISLLDENGRFTYVNRVYADNYGYEPEEMLGEHWEMLYPEDERTEVYEAILPEVRETGTWRGHTTGLRADGSTFPELHSLTETADGGLVCVVRDISERKERERDLELFRTLLDHSTDSVFVIDPETSQFLDVNDTACRQRGYTREALLERSVTDIDVELPTADAWQEFAEDLKDEGETTFDGVHRRTDGTTFPVEINATYVELDRGYVLATARDVADRRKRERKLEESEQRHRALAEYFPNGIVTLFDHDLEYTLAAGQGFDRIPVEPDDLEGKSFDDVWPPETAADLQPAFQAALAGRERSIELSYAGREWVFHAVPITDERGDVFAGMTMALDITERKEYERRLEETIAQLEESNERLEQFAYAASHDLQEPLRMVSSYLQLIEDRYGDAFDEDGEEFLAYAIDGAERMRDMIDALLAYSRVETRGEPLEPVDLEAVVADVREDLRIRLEESNADLTVKSLPRVQGDGSQLRQVFQNLLENAIEYSGDEPPEITISSERDSCGTARGDAPTRDGDRWIVSVRDEGIGIDPDNEERIFEVFERLHSRGEYDGTGIGLALCERIVERHGGDIWVDSEPGEGSTFSVALPAADE